jgi:DNA mismatch repair protein MutL
LDSAFKELLPHDSFPTYFIFIELDPKNIDVNIHPTKTEVNFKDNKMIYAILKAAVRQALGKYNITPSLDFDKDAAFDFSDIQNNRPIRPPSINIDPNYNPFDQKSKSTKSSFTPKTDNKNWESLYPEKKAPEQHDDLDKHEEERKMNGFSELDLEEETHSDKKVFQFRKQYIVTFIKSGIMFVDQNRAHERILFEKFLGNLEGGTPTSQQELFPETLTFSPGDFEIVSELKNEMQQLGFRMEKFGKNSVVFTGRPADLKDKNISEAVERIIENYQKNLLDLNQDKKTNLAQAMAFSLAIKNGKRLQNEEQSALLDQLFACNIPEVTPKGKPIFKIIALEELYNMFN